MSLETKDKEFAPQKKFEELKKEYKQEYGVLAMFISFLILFFQTEYKNWVNVASKERCEQLSRSTAVPSAR
ncbi:MAG: hypothetical protein R2860_07070 [Desulfobacterales bacterium]